MILQGGVSMVKRARNLFVQLMHVLIDVGGVQLFLLPFALGLVRHSSHPHRACRAADELQRGGPDLAKFGQRLMPGPGRCSLARRRQLSCLDRLAPHTHCAAYLLGPIPPPLYQPERGGGGGFRTSS